MSDSFRLDVMFLATESPNLIAPPYSSNGGSTDARADLQRKFSCRLLVDSQLNRKIVSYQGNKNEAGFRWMKYKEGFSTTLVERLIRSHKGKKVLDPFSGAGTTVLTAMKLGMHGTGIELLPIGNIAAQSIVHVANGISTSDLLNSSMKLLEAIKHDDYDEHYALKHVPITAGAFPDRSAVEIAKAKKFISGQTDTGIATVLNLACLSVLESVSFTRKDGQFLRWDARSGRNISKKLDKGILPTFSTAVTRRIEEIAADMGALKARYATGPIPDFITGSSLKELIKFRDEEFDCVITSPPYANRYDYTRTYALELVYLGYSQKEIKALRQSLLSATVENRSKRGELQTVYKQSTDIDGILSTVDRQAALQEVLTTLHECESELSNKNIISLLENYFTEMAVIVRELARVVKTGGVVFMVNDNVQYHGEEVPVDLILSDFAEQFGFRCEAIWMLERGKGNSSQQMGKFGRRELRKCIYKWVKARA